MNLAGLSAIYPGYIKGQEALAELAQQQEAVQAAQREKLAQAGVARAALSGALDGNAQTPPPGGLGALGGGPPAPTSPPQQPVGPGQQSMPAQPQQQPMQPPPGAGGPPPGAQAGPPPGGPPPGAPQPGMMPQAAGAPQPGMMRPPGAPPQGQPVPPGAQAGPPPGGPQRPPMPPPGAQGGAAPSIAGQRPPPASSAAPPGGASQQGAAPGGQQQPEVKPTPVMQQAVSQVGQLAQALAKANPQINAKTPEGALQLFRMIELSQKIQAPEAKAYLDSMKQIMQDHKQEQDYSAKIQKINNDAVTASLRADTAIGVAQINEARARMTAEAATNRALTLQGQLLDFRGSEGDKNREAKADQTTQKSRADTIKAATKAGVSIDPSWETSEIQQKTAEAVAKKAESTTLTDEQARYMAEASKTDPSLLSRLGSGPTGNANKTKVLGILAGTSDPKALGQGRVDLATSTAEGRRVGTQAGSVELGAQELQKFAPLVLSASEKVDRTQYPTINRIIEAASKGSGGTEIITLANNINALKNAYAQVIARGGQVTEGARKQASDLIDQSYSKGQLKAAIAAMQQEAKGAGEAATSARTDVRKGVGAGSAPSSDAGGAQADPWGIR